MHNDYPRNPGEQPIRPTYEVPQLGFDNKPLLRETQTPQAYDTQTQQAFQQQARRTVERAFAQQEEDRLNGIARHSTQPLAPLTVARTRSPKPQSAHDLALEQAMKDWQPPEIIPGLKEKAAEWQLNVKTGNYGPIAKDVLAGIFYPLRHPLRTIGAPFGIAGRTLLHTPIGRDGVRRQLNYQIEIEEMRAKIAARENLKP